MVASLGARNSTRPLSPLDISTSFEAVTITASTFGIFSINAMPSTGPMMKTPVDKTSAITARSATMVTLRQPRAGSPRSGSIKW